MYQMVSSMTATLGRRSVQYWLECLPLWVVQGTMALRRPIRVENLSRLIFSFRAALGRVRELVLAGEHLRGSILGGAF